MITGKLNLTKLKSALIEKKSKSGIVKGIFIPIEQNNLFLSEKGNVYLDIIAFELKSKREFETHMVKQSLSKELREAGEDGEILGNLNITTGGGKAGESSVETLSDDDDLPF